LDFSYQAPRITTEINTHKSFGSDGAIVDTVLRYAEELHDENINELFEKIGKKIGSVARS
jgi:hypothetical protein